MRGQSSRHLQRLIRSRRGITGLLLMVVALVPLAVIIDVALLYVSFPNAAEYVALIDFPIAVGIGGALFFSHRRRKAEAELIATPGPNPMDKLKERNSGRRAPTAAKSILDKNEEKEAEVFLETPDVEKSSRDVDEILQRMKAKEMNIGVGPGQEVDVHPQAAVVEWKPPASGLVLDPEIKSKKYKDYVLTPDKLKAPAFVCRCGHAHRFVCLTCGMTIELAAKKPKMHWVEWAPEMGAVP